MGLEPSRRGPECCIKKSGLDSFRDGEPRDGFKERSNS